MTNLRSRANLISKIIEKRKPLVEKIVTVKIYLENLNDKLGDLEKKCQDLLSDTSDVGAIRVQGRLSHLRDEVDKSLQTLSKLETRFNRETINIGVIGRARQGKSRLLRSLTGLTEKVIPDGRAGFCTGVRSKIYHKKANEAAISVEEDGTEKDATFAKVNFYSVGEFLDEVIYPYYRELKLGSVPKSLDELCADKFPKLPPDKQVDTRFKEIYSKFRRTYSGNLDQYRRLVESSQRQEKITEDEIRQYVTQDEVDQNQQPVVNYLAVKEVEVFCNFPHEDVGNITLIDLPGLGDMGYLDAERLTKTLGQEVDCVLFVRMPSATGDDWSDFDFDLYEQARKSLDILPISKWSFMVLNQVKGGESIQDNRERCEAFQHTINARNIGVARCVVADCSNETESRTKVLDPVLDYLVKEIETLDQEYARSCQKDLIKLHRQVKDELDQLKQILTQDQEFAQFNERFQELWDSLVKCLGQLIRDLKAKRTQEDPKFRQEVEEIISECREEAMIPSISSIETWNERREGYRSAYLDYIPELRAAISKKFLSLNGQLQSLMEEVKLQIAKTLINNGRLGGLSEEQGVEFFQAMADRLPKQQGDGRLSELKLGFDTLANFNVSYSGFIQRQTRRHLDKLDSDADDILSVFNVATPPIVKPPSNASSLPQDPMSDPQSPHTPHSHSNADMADAKPASPPSAAQVREAIRKLRDKTIEDCEQELKQMLTEPNEIAYSMAREFVDRTVRATGVEMEWQNFLYEERRFVWEEFRRIAEQTQKQRECSMLIEEAIAANQMHLLKFFNT